MSPKIFAAALLAMMAAGPMALAQMYGVNVTWSCQGGMAVFTVNNPGPAWPAPALVLVHAAGEPNPLVRRDLRLGAGEAKSTDPIMSFGRIVQIKVEPTWPGAQTYVASTSCQ